MTLPGVIVDAALDALVGCRVCAVCSPTSALGPVRAQRGAPHAVRDFAIRQTLLPPFRPGIAT
jgi:hypothetical protein